MLKIPHMISMVSSGCNFTHVLSTVHLINCSTDGTRSYSTTQCLIDLPLPSPFPTEVHHQWVHVCTNETCSMATHRQCCVHKICTHMHTYAHTCTCVHTYAHVCTCVHTYAHVCTCVHMCTHVCTRMHTYAHVCTRMHMCTHVCTRMHMCTHVCTRMHMCTHTCTRMHTYAHVYTYTQNTPFGA